MTVTDAYCTGDQFEVFDNGTDIGPTSIPGTSTCTDYTTNPDTALASPKWSHGVFDLGPGSHSLTFKPIASPFGSGGAFFRVDSVPDFHVNHGH